MKTKKKCIIISVGIIFLSFVALSGANAAEKKKTVITVAHIPHFTGAYAGSQAVYALAQLDVVEWINANNYIPGVELKLSWVDGGTDVAKSVAGFKKLMAERPKPVILLSQMTAASSALKKYHAEEKVPDLAAGVHPSLMDPPSWTFCVNMTYMRQAGAWVDYYLNKIWKGKGKPKFAWLTWDNPFGRGCISKETEAYIRSKGVEIVASEFIMPVPADTTAHALRLKKLGVDFVFGSIYPTALGVVLKDLDKVGMTGKITIGQSYAINQEHLVNYVGPLANGVWTTGIANLPADWPKNSPRIMEMWLKKGRDKDKTADKTFYNLMWLHFSIIAEAIRIAAAEVGPEKVNGQAVYDALTRMSSFDPWGTGCLISYSKTRREGMDSVFMTVVENGKAIVKDVAPCPEINPGGKDVPK